MSREPRVTVTFLVVQRQDPLCVTPLQAYPSRSMMSRLNTKNRPASRTCTPVAGARSGMSKRQLLFIFTRGDRCHYSPPRAITNCI